MSKLLPNLIPPFRYATVEEGLFRGGYPKSRNLRFMKRLRLKTVLSLIPDALIPEAQSFCQHHHINMLHIKVDKMKEDNIPLSYNKTLMALQIIIDPANHPLYIHCLDGADVTGLVIACLRKLQMWSTSSAMSEFSRYLHSNVIAPEEFEFVENFKNFDVTIPTVIPVWLWGGAPTFRKHSCLRLKFLNPDMMTEEEREIRDRKEKMEKEKEDFYKRRKNDLLDNLLDTSGTSHVRHRSSSHYSGSNASVASRSQQDAENNNSVPSPEKATPTDSPTMMDAEGRNSPNMLRDDYILHRPGIVNRRESKDTLASGKDRYLVDVDVDVDGVMMDGLAKVEYYNRLGTDEFGRNGRRNYEDISDGVPLEEEDGVEIEPISRTLEALALEGLGD